MVMHFVYILANSFRARCQQGYVRDGSVLSCNLLDSLFCAHEWLSGMCCGCCVRELLPNSCNGWVEVALDWARLTLPMNSLMN